MVEVTLDMRDFRARGGLNAREHWTVAHKRKKREKSVVWAFWQNVSNDLRCKLRKAKKVRVVMVRCSPSGISMDGDNLQGTLKAIRDGIADCLGRDDADPAIDWVYAQERSPWGVRIHLFAETGGGNGQRTGGTQDSDLETPGRGGDSGGVFAAPNK